MYRSSVEAIVHGASAKITTTTTLWRSFFASASHHGFGLTSSKCTHADNFLSHQSDNTLHHLSPRPAQLHLSFITRFPISWTLVRLWISVRNSLFMEQIIRDTRVGIFTLTCNLSHLIASTEFGSIAAPVLTAKYEDIVVLMSISMLSHTTIAQTKQENSMITTMTKRRPVWNNEINILISSND